MTTASTPSPQAGTAPRRTSGHVSRHASGHTWIAGLSRLTCLSGLLLGAGLASPAWAVSSTSARASAGASGSQIPLAEQGILVRTDLTSTSSAFSGGNAGGTGDAFAQLGVIKVFASAFSPAGDAVGSGAAEGSYAEDILVSSAGFNGTPARIKVGVTLQGFIDPQGSMGGTIDWSFNGAGFVGAWSAFSQPAFPGGFPVQFVSATAGGPLFYSAIHELTISFTLGVPFTVTERLRASSFKIDCGFNPVLCQSSTAGSVNIDFGHSSYWNGVSSISLLDASGSYVPADLSLFSVTSTTGVDMKGSFVPTAVPEPAGALLMLLGLGGLGALQGWQRRRRGTQQPRQPVRS